MSYILDALKRADAERDLGQVPGLHSQSPVTLTSQRPARRWRGIGLAAAATLLVGGALLWRAWSPAHTPVPAPEPVAVAGSSAAPLMAPDTTPPATPAASKATAAGSLRPRPILNPAPATADKPEPAPATAASAPDQATPTPRPTPPAGAPAPPPAAAAPAPEPVSASASGLRISGSTWSENPHSRTLIVNGQMVQEGQEVAPGVTLEVIGRQTAIFRRGQERFSLRH